MDFPGIFPQQSHDLGQIGQVVGRQGMTAKAIRSLLRIVGVKNNARVNLKIEEPEGSTRPPRSEPPNY